MERFPSMRSWFRLALLLWIARAAMLDAATYTGTVVSVQGDVVKVAMDGDLMPPVGAQAQIFFKIAGGDDEILVATGRALKIDFGDMLVKIDEATGTVDKGQLARFGPAAPIASTPPPATDPSSTPASASSIVGMWMGLEPGGDKISFTFREDGTVSYVRLKGKKKNILRGKYRTDCAATPCRLELFAFEVNGVRAKGETITGLFEVHEIDMRFDLSKELQTNPGNGFTKGAITLIRAKSESLSEKNPVEPIQPHPPPPKASPTVTAPRFAGAWRVQNENAAYTLRLRQDGTRVTGSYDLYDGTLKGNVQADTLVANWNQPGNRRGGSARLRLSADGQTLVGSWAYDPALYSSGLTGTGTWTFRRIGP